jgi:hypothetical protein
MITDSHERNYGCRVTTNITYHSMNTVVIENELIRISILLDKGSDIFELLYKPKDVDFMWRSPIGIRNPEDDQASEMTFEYFMRVYHGGWQEIFPSGSGSSNYMGVETGFHGEVAYLKWNCEVTKDTPKVVEIKLKVKTVRTPFVLEKTIRLESYNPVIFFEENIKNCGNVDMAFMWGHHPSFGAPFLSEECILSLPQCEIMTQPNPGLHSRFSAGQTFNWPYAVDVKGNSIDLRAIPNKEVKYTDMLYARFLNESWYTITNRELEIGIGFVWPKEMFPYLWIWQEFGGTSGFPWYENAYTMALEPFTSLPKSGQNGLEEAIKNGTAAYISSKEEIKKEFKVVVFESNLSVKKLNQSGSVEYYENTREGNL